MTVDRGRERALRRRLVARDASALSELYDFVAPRAFGLALSMTGDSRDAEEIVSDTFVQVWESAATFDPDRGSLSAWVLTICRSRCLDRVRTLRRRGRLRDRAEREIAAFTTADPPADPEELALDRSLGARVAVALARLPAEKRRPIELAYFGGLTQREIAAELDVPLGTVKTRIRTGMQTLRETLPTEAPGAARLETVDP